MSKRKQGHFCKICYGNFEYEPIIIKYEKKHEYPFLISTEFAHDQMNDLLEVLAIKSEGLFEGEGHYYEFDEVMEGIGCQDYMSIE